MSEMKEQDVKHFDPFMGKVLKKVEKVMAVDGSGYGYYRFSFETIEGGHFLEFTIYKGGFDDGITIV